MRAPQKKKDPDGARLIATGILKGTCHKLIIADGNASATPIATVADVALVADLPGNGGEPRKA